MQPMTSNKSRNSRPVNVDTTVVKGVHERLVLIDVGSETYKQARGYKTFVMLNSAEHEIYPADNIKMPTIVGILIFISMMDTTSERL